MGETPPPAWGEDVRGHAGSVRSEEPCRGSQYEPVDSELHGEEEAQEQSSAKESDCPPHSCRLRHHATRRAILLKARAAAAARAPEGRAAGTRARPGGWRGAGHIANCLQDLGPIGISSAWAARIGSKYSRSHEILLPAARTNNTYSCR